MSDKPTLGFIGLGVMGSRMCANLVRRSDHRVVVHDPVPEAVAAAVRTGAAAAGGAAEVGDVADVVFLSLPSITQVEEVVGEIVAAEHPPRMIVDMSTSDVSRTRRLAAEVDGHAVALVDAPVARLRQAAEDGTLLITVGSTEEQFNEVKPFLDCMGSDVVHAGATGNGQVLKILNNMVLFITMNALAEAMALGRGAGVDGRLLFETLQLGSADSFALRRTAMATLVPDEFPEKAFPVDYAIKDLALALGLADDLDLPSGSARQTMDLLERTRDAGHGASYYPVMIKLLDGRASGE